MSPLYVCCHYSSCWGINNTCQHCISVPSFRFVSHVMVLCDLSWWGQWKVRGNCSIIKVFFLYCEGSQRPYITSIRGVDGCRSGKWELLFWMFQHLQVCSVYSGEVINIMLVIIELVLWPRIAWKSFFFLNLLSPLCLQITKLRCCYVSLTGERTGLWFPVKGRSKSSLNNTLNGEMPFT